MWFCASDRSPTQSSLLLGDDGVRVICIFESLSNRSRDGKKTHPSFSRARDERNRESLTAGLQEMRSATAKRISHLSVKLLRQVKQTLKAMNETRWLILRLIDVQTIVEATHERNTNLIFSLPNYSA